MMVMMMMMMMNKDTCYLFTVMDKASVLIASSHAVIILDTILAICVLAN